jgi:CBS domain-containing protein
MRTPKKLKLLPAAEAPPAASPDHSERTVSDSLPRLGDLQAAHRRPVRVSKEADIAIAMTEMAMHRFSQLPVMTGNRTVTGLVSWKTIGEATLAGRPLKLVMDCMDPAPPILSARAPLLDAVKRVIDHEVILVRDESREICGLVTTSDISAQFRELAGAFLMISEIEQFIRRIISAACTVDEMRAARLPSATPRPVRGAADLTFGEYVRILQNPDYWNRLHWRLNQQATLKHLARINDIRNSVMHFHEPPVSADDRVFLDEVRGFLRRAVKGLQPRMAPS